MNIHQIKIIIKVLDKARSPILCNNEKLWKLEVERVLLLLRSEIENRRLKGKIGYYRHRYKNDK